MQNHLALDGSVVSNFRATYPELYDFFDINSLITTVQADYDANHALLLYDSVNDEATMPDFLDKTVWGGNTVEEKEAGLPNITGVVNAVLSFSPGEYESEALYWFNHNANIKASTSSVASNNNNADIAIDASRSNPIYGNSITVQPPAIQLIPQIRYTQDYIESAGGGTSIEDWETAHSYSVGDLVIEDDKIWQCNTAHTSTTFNTDINNWTLISGSGLVDWQATTNYKEDDIFVYDGQIYKVLVGFTSGATFAEINILNDYTLASWQANTSYTAGEYFEESGVVYEVLNNFTSGATFAVTSDIAVYTPITWASGTNVNVNDLVEDSGNYYIALVNFTCGDTFTKVAFEKYVPLSLTETQIEEIIEAFNPAFDGALGFVVQDSAPAHNAVFRSNDLTDRLFMQIA